MAMATRIKSKHHCMLKPEKMLIGYIVLGIHKHCSYKPTPKTNL